MADNARTPTATIRPLSVGSTQSGYRLVEVGQVFACTACEFGPTRDAAGQIETTVDETTSLPALQSERSPSERHTNDAKAKRQQGKPGLAEVGLYPRLDLVLLSRSRQWLVDAKGFPSQSLLKARDRCKCLLVVAKQHPRANIIPNQRAN
jgi:hypothetical protein